MLIKHIFQRIQMSRKAVDKTILNQQNQEINQIKDLEENPFATPIQKRTPQIQESVLERQNFNFNEIKKNKSKGSKPYLTYTDSSQIESNAFEGSKAGLFYNHIQNQVSLEDARQFQLFNDQNFDRVKQEEDSTAEINEEYLSDKRNNLYDISGLKLKITSLNSKDQFGNIQWRKTQKQSCTSSESSKGLFQKEISNKKESFNEKKASSINFLLPQNEFIQEGNFSNLKKVQDRFNKERTSKLRLEKKERVDQFRAVDEPGYYQQHRKLKFDSDSLQNNFYQTSQSSPQQTESKSAPEGFIKQNKTKFSSISKQQPSESTELNYISFSKPQNKLRTEINHKIQRFNALHSGGCLQDNMLDNLSQNKLKRVGSIRSNFNNSENKLNDSKYQTSEQMHGFDVYPGNLQRSSKFSQQKSFRNIKELPLFESPLTLQQNRQLNKEQPSRPSVKFYNKQQLKIFKGSRLSKSRSRQQISRINKQVTSRLYNENQIKKKYLDTIKARAQNKKEDEIEEIQELRDRPKINLMSKLLADQRYKANQKLEDYLISHGKAFEVKRQEMANKEAIKQLQQCSFTPQITENSYRLSALNRSKSKSRLSNHSEVKCSKVASQLFQPVINKLSNQIVKSKGNFEERQHAFIQQKNGKIFRKLQQQRRNQKTDPVSGHQLYRPHLSLNTIKIAEESVKKQRQNKNIYSYLYNLSKINHPQHKLNSKPLINPQSQKLVYELQQKRLNWLFLELDNDEDGIISSQKICIEQIPIQILEIIAPVLQEMEQLNTELNLEDFKNAIKNLNKNLDPYQKSILYNYNYAIKAAVKT